MASTLVGIFLFTLFIFCVPIVMKLIQKAAKKYREIKRKMVRVALSFFWHKTSIVCSTQKVFEEEDSGSDED